MHSSHGDHVKCGTLRAGALKAPKKVSGNFLLSFIVSSSELIDALI